MKIIIPLNNLNLVISLERMSQDKAEHKDKANDKRFENKIFVAFLQKQ